MAEVSDWNARIIAEFRANGGKVGGSFEGAPVVLMHHVGRKSGKESVNPVMYMPDADHASTIFVFASKAGAPTHPDWYWNMTEAGRAVVEVGTETYDVTVRELTGDERDTVYADQARRYPGFAEYAEKTAGIRVIPVLALTRV
jgi:deazaflavin-dependent oxidoreductase (nitroreductase family)